jgi:small subunit ribosomal protein S6
MRRPSLRNYQSVLILKPDLDEDQVDQSIEKITEIIKKFDGSVIKLEKWGKKRLAYRVKKIKFGYYLNIYHTCEPVKVPDLEKEYQLYGLIIKYLVIRLEESDIERVMSKAAEVAESSEANTDDKPKAAVAGASESTKAEEEGDSKKDVTAEKSD